MRKPTRKRLTRLADAGKRPVYQFAGIEFDERRASKHSEQ
jgi:hypothetical protein